MRYAFDNEAIAVINRVHGAVNQLSLTDYGQANGTLLNVLWFEANQKADWGADSDVVQEMPIYKFMDQAWHIVMDSILDHQVQTTSEQSATEANDAAMNLILKLENRIYLACVVSNAISALEGSAANVFNNDQLLERVNVEFKADRNIRAKRARKLLKGHPVFEPIFFKDGKPIIHLMDGLA